MKSVPSRIWSTKKERNASAKKVTDAQKQIKAVKNFKIEAAKLGGGGEPDSRREAAKKYGKGLRFKGKEEANFFFESRGVTRVRNRNRYNESRERRGGVCEREGKQKKYEINGWSRGRV